MQLSNKQDGGALMNNSKIKKCFCGCNAELLEDYGIFFGQNYGDRYPDTVAKQNNGYKIRCVVCGLQTCWWHYEKEALSAWNIPKRN